MDPPEEQDADLGQTRRRDPDALPPSNLFEAVMYWLYHATAALGGGNVLFAIKAGLLTGKLSFVMSVEKWSSIMEPVALSLPYHIKSSAQFAYGRSSYSCPART